MNRLDEIHELYEFNAWAARKMFESTAPLTEEELARDMKNSFSSIRDTLVHIVGAEWVWLARWNGISPSAIPNTTLAMSHDAIVQWWSDIDTQRTAFLRNLDLAGLDAIVSYRNFSGIDFALPLWQMMRHQVNHSTYHRGQVATMLKQLGYKPLSSDLILMYQERQKAAINA